MRAALAAFSLVAVACGNPVPRARETYEIPSPARNADVEVVGSSANGRFVVLGARLDQRGVVIIDRDKHTVTYDAHGQLVTDDGALVESADGSIRDLDSGSTFRFPGGATEVPRTFKPAGRWLVRLAGETATATVTAVSADGQSWSAHLPVDAGSHLEAFDASGASGSIAFYVDGPAPDVQDAEVVVLSLADGTLKTRFPVPSATGRLLKLSDDGTKLILVMHSKFTVIDTTSGAVVATGDDTANNLESNGPGTNVRLSPKAFVLFEYWRLPASSHLSPGTSPDNECHLASARIDGATFHVTDLREAALAKRLAPRSDWSSDCRMRGVVHDATGTLAVLVESGRVRLVPIH